MHPLGMWRLRVAEEFHQYRVCILWFARRGLASTSHLEPT
jgi:hypothetical protein